MQKAPSSRESPLELTPLSKLKNRTPLCGHLYLLISAKLFLAALMEFVKDFLKSMGHREEIANCGFRIADCEITTGYWLLTTGYWLQFF
jgi:hypothetical protein